MDCALDRENPNEKRIFSRFFPGFFSLKIMKQKSNAPERLLCKGIRFSSTPTLLNQFF